MPFVLCSFVVVGGARQCFTHMCCTMQVAGVRPVSEVAGVENIDVSDYVKAHGDYPHRF